MKQNKLSGILGCGKVMLAVIFTVGNLFGLSESLIAQEDVSDIYLSNSGFNTNCNYTSGGTETVATADPGNLSVVDGWSLGSSPAWSAAASFEFGWNGDFNSSGVPSQGTDGSSGSGQGCLGITAGWGGSVSYYQEVILPAGVYELNYALLFENETEVSANLIAWIPNGGSPLFSDETTVSATNQWADGSLEFTLRTQTAGTIQVGMQAFQSGSGSNAKMFIDYVKLLYYPADKSVLQGFVNDANDLLSNPQNVPVGSTVYADLEHEITEAQAILNEPSSSAQMVFDKEDMLNLKMKAVLAANYEYTLADASLENPVDVSEKILNRDFEANGGSTTNWTTSLTTYTNTNTLFTGAPNPNHVLDGDPNESTVGYQTIKNIPSGTYIVRAAARGRAEQASRMFISGEAGAEFGSEHRVSTEVQRIGDVGGSLNYGFNLYETPYVVLSEGEFDLTLGVYFEGDCGWSSADNFQLLYCGSTDALVNQLKEELTALRDSSNLPPTFDKSAVNTLLATELTGGNDSELTSNLQVAITSLTTVIDQYLDPRLLSIKIDGVSLVNFSPDVETYTFTIYSPETVAAVPEITAVPMSEYAPEPVLVNAESIPGVATFTATSGTGAEKTYTISLNHVQATNLINANATVDNFKDEVVQISGKGMLTLTGTSGPLDGGYINIASRHAWVCFSNMRPSEVVNGPLENIKIFGVDAMLDANVRVTQYGDGAVVIPHSDTYEPLTVYAGANLSGASLSIPINTYFKTAELGTMNNNIQSFTLERGYMASFASNTDGTGTSRIYVADKNSITIHTMPDGLENNASFVVVRPWRWPTKKAWRGNESDALRFNTTSRYDYNNNAYSTLDIEYVPMRHNPGWNSYNNFLDKFSSTHALGYNEPDNPVDDGYSPLADAIDAWPNMLASGLRLGSPAVTDGGLNWLYGFMDECEARNYRVDFVAWHFYRRGYTAQGLYDAMKSIYNRTGRPLWITEFNNGCNWTYDGSNPVPSTQQNGVTIDAFIQMMDTCSFVERYFVWNGCNEQLRMTNSSNGELYPAGVAYRDNESNLAFTKDHYNSESIYDDAIWEPADVVFAEAETYSCAFTGVLESDYAGYSGTGYVNSEQAAGTTISFKINAQKTGVVQFGIGYANGGMADRPISIKVDGVEVVADLPMPYTGWSNYQRAETIFALEQGVREITLTAKSSSGFGNIDYYYFTENVSFMGCQSVVQEIALKGGWNLISLNVIPDDSSIVSIFNGQPVRAIKTMEAFWNSSQAPYLNSLQSLVAGEGYLVYMDSPNSLSVTGEPADEGVNLPETTGSWQLIGSTYQNSTPFSVELNETNCQTIKNFDGFWVPNGTNQSIDEFTPGKAYFMK